MEYLQQIIKRLLESRERVVLALDGPCGSGKTTLARRLQELYDCEVIAMDDFFLPAELRTRQRLAEPGGNIHYERFEQEAAKPLAEGKPFQYRVFDCARMDYHGCKTIAPGALTVVEGSYSLHPRYAALYDYRVFVRCPEAERQERLRARGPELYRRFVAEWIPMEEAYFAAFHIAQQCDHVVDTGGV